MIAIFLFYNQTLGRKGIWAFDKNFKHVNVIIFDGKDYILTELGSEGIMHRVIRAKSASSIIRNLKVIKSIIAIVSIFVNKRLKFNKYTPLVIKSCNELCRYLTGIDIGITINPKHLFNKIIKLNNKKNFEILSNWKREFLTK